MSIKNKNKDIIVSYYENDNCEDIRFDRPSHKFEYLTTMRYIKKYAKKSCKILEIGAATGNYSVELAKMGYNVTSIELVDFNLKILKKKAKGLTNIKAYQGDCLDLSRFKDGSFDVVLNLGPMYHLYTQQDKDQAIKETLRVCKSGGVCMFAYISHSSIVYNHGIRKGKINELFPYFDKDYKIKDEPKEVFSSYYVEDFNKQFENTNSTFIKNIATDGQFSLLRDYIDDGKMSEKDFKQALKWHFGTCERLDQLGLSCHLLYICKKK